MKMKKTLVAVLMLGTLAGCAEVSNTDVGTLSGAAIGGLVGSRFGHGTGRVLATAGGAVAGALIGNKIGQYMDDTDRMKMQQALESSPDRSVKSWSNPNSGNSYRVEPTRTYYEDQQPCREYTTTANIGGKSEKIYGTACRTADGSWKVVNS